VSASAQLVSSADDVVDRVVAIVGDSVVLQTQVLEGIEQMRLQGATIPTDPAGRQAVFAEVLESYVNRVLILQAAAKDTLLQTDEERVEEIVNEEMEQRSQSFPSQAAFQQALQAQGMTLGAYRDFLRTQVRHEQIQQMYVQSRIQNADPITVSEDELLQAFQEARGRLQQRPRLLTFEQVVLAPEPSDSARAAARREAQQLLDSIRAGGDFQALAQTHSDDPGSAPNGGDLDWFRRGQMVREFEDAAFALRDGQVSELVETEFGFHIIKVERSRQGERKGRHILVQPELGPGDVSRTRSLADSVADLARSGTPMDELFDRYSDPLAPDTLTVAYDQLDQLPPGYASAVRSAARGDVVGPLEYTTARGETRFAVVRVREIREAGAYTYEDVKPQLAQQLQQTKQIDRILDELRSRTHVEIRM
jgi:parvulin-like peptidyl-prolyl isomerase